MIIFIACLPAGRCDKCGFFDLPHSIDVSKNKGHNDST